MRFGKSLNGSYSWWRNKYHLQWNRSLNLALFYFEYSELSRQHFHHQSSWNQHLNTVFWQNCSCIGNFSLTNSANWCLKQSNSAESSFIKSFAISTQIALIAARYWGGCIIQKMFNRKKAKRICMEGGTRKKRGRRGKHVQNTYKARRVEMEAQC